MKLKEKLKMLKSKKSAVIVVCFALLCIAGATNNMLHNKASLSTSADYIEFEETQERLHNGEVLVDSLDLTSINSPETSTEQLVESDDLNSADGDNNGTINENNDENNIVPTETSIVSSDNLGDISNTGEYFQEIRASVTLDRNQIISMLTDVIEETDVESEKLNATDQKLRIIEYMNIEKECENLIRNKGFSDAFVLITDKSVNVTVDKQEISQSDAAKILDIVMRQTGRDAGQIIVQTK